MARSYYNRGIVRFEAREMDRSEADFRRAISLLKPLAQSYQDPGLSLELARAYGNFGNQLRYEDKASEAQSMLQEALNIHERLMTQFPDNREYKYEMASFLYDQALLLAEGDHYQTSQENNQRALDLLNDLARPATSLSIGLAKSHNLAAQVLETQNVSAAEAECERTLAILEQLARNPKVQRGPEFQRVYRDLGYNYLELAHVQLQRNSVEDAIRSMGKLSRVMGDLSGDESNILNERYKKLQNEIQARVRK
jgi:tetratricopeptide (TPR) repeat protein